MIANIFIIWFFCVNLECVSLESTVNLMEVNDVLLDLRLWSNITSTSTCGEKKPERFCIVTSTGLDKGHHCEWCDATKANFSHHISYAIEGSERYWKSKNNPEKVFITLSLKQPFFVTSLLIKMGPSPKPAVWTIERSDDFGLSYKPWRHFTGLPQACKVYFGIEFNLPIIHVNTVTCQSQRVNQIENEEIVIDLIKGRPGYKSYAFNEEFENWTKATNIRLIFYKLQTFLGELVVKDSSVMRTQFYTLRDIVVSGRCLCHGHDNGCEFNKSTGEMECQCLHNTCGRHCETCCSGYHHWKPWTRTQKSTYVGCQKCNCFEHSNNCYFNATVAKKKLSLDIEGRYRGGGVCVNCLHNTDGANCQKCKHGFYRSTGVSPLDPSACKKCLCNIIGSVSISCNETDGWCICKPNVIGPICNSCAEKFWNFPNCKKCNCSSIGSLKETCDSQSGKCYCKPGMSGLKCDVCEDLNNSIVTQDGCLVCQHCSLEHLNSVKALGQSVNSLLYQLNFNTPKDSWVHFRLSFVNDIVTKSRSYLTVMLKIFRKEIGWKPHVFETLRTKQISNLNKVIGKIEHRTIQLSTDYNFNNPRRLEKAKMTKESSYKTLNIFLNVLFMTKQSNDLIEGTISILSSIMSNPVRCTDSCEELVKSRGHDWHKEIFQLQEIFSTAFNTSHAEFKKAKSLHSFATSLEKPALIVKLRKNKISFKNVARLLITNYLELELLSEKLKTAYLFLNPGRVFRLKEKVADIVQNIKNFDELNKMKFRIANIRMAYNYKAFEWNKKYRLFETKVKLLKYSTLNTTENLKVLKKFSVQSRNKVLELISAANWISKQFKFVDGVTKPFRLAIEQYELIPNIVSESKNKVAEVEKIRFQVDKFIKNMYQQLTNLTVGQEEFSFSYDSNGGLPHRSVDDEDDYPSSGFFKDEPNDSLNVKSQFRLQNGVSIWREFLNEERTKNEWTHRAIKDKVYELQMLPQIMGKSEASWNGNDVKMKYVIVEISSLTKAHDVFEFSRNNVLFKSKSNKAFSDRILANVFDMNTRYKNRINKLQKDLTNGQLLFKKALSQIKESVSKISSLVKKIFDANVRQLSSFPMKKIGAVRNNIDKFRQSLSTFQTPLSFNSPSYVSITLPELTNSLVTILEFWIKLETSDAFILKLGDVNDSKTSISLYVKSQQLIIEIKRVGKLPVTSTKSDDLLSFGHWHFIEVKWIANVVFVFMGIGVSKPKQILKVEVEFFINREIAPIIYLGGLPTDTFYQYFIGCLGGLKINGFLVNMYNWNLAKGHVQTCRSLPSDKTKDLSTLSFHGNGGLNIEPPLNSFGVIPTIEFFLRAVQFNGVIAYFTDQTQDEQLIVKLVDGRITVLFETTNGLQNVELKSAKKYNDGKLHHVKLTTIGKQLIKGLKLSVDDLDRINGALYNPVTRKTVISLGTMRENEDSNFVGCLIGLKINNRTLTQMSRSNNRFDYLMAICPTVMGRCMCLSENGSKSINVKPLGFRITKLNLLFSLDRKPVFPGITIFYYSSSPYTSLEIYASSETNLNVRYEMGYLSKVKKLNQRLLLIKKLPWHTIILENQFSNNRSVLFIDEHRVDLPIEIFSDIRFSAQNILYLGGKPLVIRDGYSSRYHTTCYRDFLLNDELQDFSNYAIASNLEVC